MAARLINDISTLLVVLTSEKITERKNGASKLQVLLHDPETVDAIDQCSNKSGSSSSVTWDFIVQRVSKHVLLELHGNNANKIRDAILFYQSSIQIAEKRGPKLKSSVIYSQLLNFLSQDKKNSHIITVCSSILHKYFLSRKHHVMELDVNKWHAFMEYYTEKIMKSMNSKESLQSSIILKELFTIAESLPYLITDLPFEFFSSIFTHIKGEKHDSLLREILACLRVFIKQVMLDWKYQVDELITSLFSPLIGYFRSSVKNASQLQYELSGIFMLWIENHKHINESFFLQENDNNVEFLSMLSKIYEVIKNGIIQMGTRVFHTRNDGMKKICELAALIICESSESLNKIQEEAEDQDKSSTHLYKDLCNQIEQSSNSNSFMAWLDILQILIKEKDNWNITFLDFESLYTLFDSLLSQVKREDLLEKLLIILINIIENMKIVEKQHAKKLYQNVHDNAVKMIRSRKNTTISFQLILVIWKGGYRNHSSHVYRLFVHENTFLPTSASLQLLEYLMEISYFPELVDYESLGNKNPLFSKYPLRNQLIHWLIPNKNDATNKFGFLTDISSINSCCKILVSLLSVSPVHSMNGCKLKYIKPIEDYVVEKLKDLFTEFISISTKKKYSIEELMHHFEDSTNVFSYFALILTNFDDHKNETSFAQLQQHCCQTAKKMFGWFHEVVKSNTDEKVARICHCLESIDFLVKIKAKTMSSILTRQMYNFLENIMMRKLILNRSNTQMMTSSPASKKAKLENDFMDFDEDSPNSNNSQSDIDGLSSNFDIEENTESKAIYLSSKILIHVYMHSISFEGRGNFLSTFKSALKMDSYPAAMLVSFFEIVEEHSYNLIDDEVLSLMSCLKGAFAKHHNNQDVCKTLLQKTIFLINEIEKNDGNESEQARLLMVKILGVFCSLRSRKYCAQVRQVMVDIISHIAQFSDVDGMWKLEIDSENSGSNLTSPSSLVCQFMLDDSFLVRFSAVKSIKTLFHQKPYTQQLKIYSYVKSIFKKLHSGTSTNKDQVNNQAIMIMLIAKEMLCHALPFEKQILWILIEFCDKKILNEKQINKVITAACDFHGYDSVVVYMETRIDYILKMFIEKGSDLFDFPHNCFAMSSESFLKMIFRTAVPYLLLIEDENSIDGLQRRLEMEQNQFLIECLPNIVLITFPSYQRKINGCDLNEEDEQSIKCLEKYQEMIDAENFNSELKKQFVEVFKLLFLHIFDEENKSHVSSKYTRDEDIFTFYPQLSSEKVGDILTSIASCYAEQNAVHLVLLKKMDNIPHLLSYFALYVCRTGTYLEKVNFMKIYYCFAVLLLKHFHTIQTTCGRYVIKELIHRLLFFIDQDTSSSVSNICFDIIGNIFKMIPKYACVKEEVGEALPLLSSKLCSYIAAEISQKHTSSLKLLSFLVLVLTEQDGLEDFKEAISSMGMFPDIPELQDVNNKLISLKLTFDRGEQDIESIYKTIKEYKLINKQQLINLMSITKTRKLFNKVELGYLKSIFEELLQHASSLSKEEKILAVDCFGFMMTSLASTNVEDSVVQHDCKNYVLIDRLVDICFMTNHKTSQVGLECLLKTLSIFDSSLIAPLKQLKSFKYISAFLSPRRKKNGCSQSVCSMEDIQDKLLEIDLFLHHTSQFNTWMCRLVAIFLQEAACLLTPFYSHLLDICQLDAEYSRQCFPYIIECMLLRHDQFKGLLSAVIDQWIMSCLQHIKHHQPNNDMIEKTSVVVSLIQHLHDQGNNDGAIKNKTCWDSKFHLSLNYLHLAELSEICSKNFMAALFLEFHLDPRLNKTEHENSDSSTRQRSRGTYKSSQQSTLNDSEFFTSENDGEWKELAYKIYESLQEEDALYGLDTCFLSFEEKRLQTYKLEKNFAKSLCTNDILGTNKTAHGKERLVNDLVESGLLSTAFLCSVGLQGNDMDKFSELQFESAWKNGIWEDMTLSVVSERCYHGNIHNCLSAIRSSDDFLLEKNMKDLKLNLLGTIHSTNNSSTSDFLNRCQTIIQLENTTQLILSGTCSDLPDTSKLTFDKLEEAMTVKTQALKIGCNSRKNEITSTLFEHLLTYNKLAHQSKRYHVCERIMHDLHELHTANIIDDSSWKIDEAKLYWVKDEKKHALFRLKSLVNEMERGFQDDMDIYPVALSLYGHWLGETKSQNPVTIMENYLEPAIEIMEGDSYKGKYSPVEAYHSLGKYADEQYQSIFDYIKSPAFDNRQALIRKNKVDVMKHSSEMSKSKDITFKRYYSNLKKHCDEDEAELEQLVQTKRTFLAKAIKYYCKCLQMKKVKYQMKILRICSLWFSNYSDREIAVEVKNDFNRISSDNFLLVMYQLAARLGTNMAMTCQWFNDILENVIIRCVSEHPHHSLFILLALCNANIDKTLATQNSKGRTKARSASSSDGNQVRVNAAKKVLEKVRSCNPKLIEAAQQLAYSYVELAYWDVQNLKKEKGPFHIPENKLIHKINNLDSLAIPTIDIPVQQEYTDVVHIVKFDTSFSLAGGINLPKIITCIGSDGIKRKQLVKGRDDLRQDAVMQQVFNVVNQLFSKDSQSKSLNLNMRTYKVVPLSQKSGVLQWCDGTIPIGNYLVHGQGGVSGAHKRYYPKDWSTSECREKLGGASGESSKMNVYQRIEKNFHPVFRYFFLEKFKNANVWFNRRLMYTRSCAVASIVGYIVGLGDRHCQNILIDCNSAEMIHIDLGVAFEQGKLLPTPETIPFRLTRDIVDGMGVLGIEGVYRRCCERSLRVLKESKEAVITIVEVLLYDPLSQWNISMEKARKLQRETSKTDTEALQVTLPTQVDEHQKEKEESDKNMAAERVLIRLEQKLTGYEDHTYLACEGQVNYLIQEARSKRNLSKLFVGWQPYV